MNKMACGAQRLKNSHLRWRKPSNIAEETGPMCRGVTLTYHCVYRKGIRFPLGLDQVWLEIHMKDSHNLEADL